MRFKLCRIHNVFQRVNDHKYSAIGERKSSRKSQARLTKYTRTVQYPNWGKGKLDLRALAKKMDQTYAHKRTPHLQTCLIS